MMNRLFEIINSSIGRKTIMAITGIVVVGFLLGHMTGNLLVFKGPDAINHYAEFLQSKPLLIWTNRIVLLVSLILHIWAATTLTLDAWNARPVPYASSQRILETTYAARTMRWGGPIIALYVIYHLLHFTVGRVGPLHFEGDVYMNIVTGFRIPYIAGFYIICMLAIGFHLYHGIWSFFQTLGANHPLYNPLRRIIAVAIALTITAGFISVPLGVIFRVIGGDIP